jgi:hypothetical protein
MGPHTLRRSSRRRQLHPRQSLRVPSTCGGQPAGLFLRCNNGNCDAISAAADFRGHLSSRFSAEGLTERPATEPSGSFERLEASTTTAMVLRTTCRDATG